jgi:hypothetical protein
MLVQSVIALAAPALDQPPTASLVPTILTSSIPSITPVAPPAQQTATTTQECAPSAILHVLLAAEETRTNALHAHLLSTSTTRDLVSALVPTDTLEELTTCVKTAPTCARLAPSQQTTV